MLDVIVKSLQCFFFCLTKVSSSTVYHFSKKGYGFLLSPTGLLSRNYFPQISLLDILLQNLAQCVPSFTPSSYWTA
jgi:hypothetical protein